MTARKRYVEAFLTVRGDEAGLALVRVD